MQFDWFYIAKRLKAISQAGKHFARDEYELDRHKEIEEIAAQVLERHTDLQADEIVRLLQKDTGYPTPKVDSRGVVFREGKVLLVKEIEDGGWTLPGGWCDIGMTPSENVEREVWEESGFEVKAKRLLAVYDRNRQGHKPEYVFDIYKMFFLCEIVGGEARTSNETSDVKFFGRDEIPALSRGRTLEHQLDKFFEMNETGQWVTDFD